MQSKKFTITAAQINAGTAIETDISIYDTPNATRWIPTYVLYVNSSGCEVGYVYLFDDAEKADMVLNPTNYAYIPIASSRSSGTLPYCRYLTVKYLSGTATGNIDIYVSGYGRN
jgi:hypothetical protein